jgi:hypothetical protein
MGVLKGFDKVIFKQQVSALLARNYSQINPEWQIALGDISFSFITLMNEIGTSPIERGAIEMLHEMQDRDLPETIHKQYRQLCEDILTLYDELIATQS